MPRSINGGQYVAFSSELGTHRGNLLVGKGSRKFILLFCFFLQVSEACN